MGLKKFVLSLRVRGSAGWRGVQKSGSNLSDALVFEKIAAILMAVPLTAAVPINNCSPANTIN